jgi:hypothetical protein
MEANIHPVYDTGERFTIDPITRSIKCEDRDRIYLVREEHNSEVFTFTMPRYIEGHDMALCNEVTLHYVNTSSATKETSNAIYRVTDFGVDPDDSKRVLFTWGVSCKATMFAGPLVFAVHFKCKNEETHDTRYKWSTSSCNVVTVLDTVIVAPEEGAETDLQEKTVAPSRDQQVIVPDGDFRGLSRVTVDPIPSTYYCPDGVLKIEENGQYDVREFYYARVSVPTTGRLQEKTITTNGTFEPDPGFGGLSKVIVNVPQDSSHPREIATVAEMDALLSTATSAYIGAVYKYTGPSSSKYENGALYIIKDDGGA